MFCTLAAVLVAAAQNVLPISNGTALTLPAARHLLRLDPGDGKPATWLLAVQQGGANGHWLSLYRSTDEARSWSWYAPIRGCCERDTPDLIAIGMDVAMVYSYEGPQVSGSTEHDVFFQRWRWRGTAEWGADPPVAVFDSTSSSTAYLRAELARDSQGRLWVWAQRLNADGSFTLVISVSTDGGASFQPEPSLDTFANRPGGRILPVAGNRMMLLYGTHNGGLGYMRLRDDSDPLQSWGARQVVFPEGIYHGAALSAASDGSGGIHLVYKDVGGQLWYRHWSGSWSGRILVESTADWALQPAITRVGGSLVICSNRMLSSGTSYQFRYRVLENGALGSSILVDGSGGFKGYPGAVEWLPETSAEVPCFYGNTPNADSGGSLALVFAPTPNATPLPSPPPGGGTPDAGTADGGAPGPGASDAGTPDAGTADAGTPPQSGVLFSDAFNRTTGMGPAWRIVAGAWITPGTWAESDLHPWSQVSVQSLSCADCSVQARVMNSAAATAALDLRESGAGDRYDVALLSSGRLQIRRYRGGATTVLGDVESGVADLHDWATIALSATGAGPVHLVGSVNGVVKLTITDASASAIVTPGTAGMATNLAGVVFDDFTVTGQEGGGAAGGVPDAGTAGGGAMDGGTPDAGSPDAGIPDGGAGSARVLFKDDFNRTVASGLGPGWTILSGAWLDDDRANSDARPLNRAAPAGVSCADCSIDAKMINFRGGDAMLELRGSGSDRYALALTAGGALEVRRYRAGVNTVLGSIPSGLADLTVWHAFSFAVQGDHPVTLTASVDGIPKISVTDASASALVAAGAAGIAAAMAGIVFDDFVLTGSGSGQ
jgi:hypothetical protein